jgi:hypothetical protein
MGIRRESIKMYAIRTKNGLLNSFYTNGLPTTRKAFFNENTNKFEPKFTLRDIMNCTGGYMIFDTQQEAEQHINYIKSEVEDSRERYESALQGSTDKLLSIINGFTTITV